MRIDLSLAVVSWTALGIDAFVSPRLGVKAPFLTCLSSSPSADSPKAQLGLLTFDLDDTLYPISPVIDDANEGFARAMERFGFNGLTPNEINDTGAKIREEIAEEDPEAAAILTHTEIRRLAIRRRMEEITLRRKLASCADDWATQVEYLSEEVVNSAKKWSSIAVSESMVNAVLSTWEMERHHSAERHLYPEVIDALEQIKKEHPDVIVGAVTDGKANPLLMPFTLAPYFDFCLSWEDDQGGRSQFFRQLASVTGNAELSWIYNAAREKYYELAYAEVAMKERAPTATNPDDKLWIHVGDDLAYDVGGSKQCGAKTIYLELAKEYGQTARHRFNGQTQPGWSTSSKGELASRKILNEAANDCVDKKLSFLTRLPDAVNEIVEEASVREVV